MGRGGTTPGKSGGGSVRQSRGQLEPINISTDGMTFESGFARIKYLSDTRKLLNAQQTMKDTGVDESTAREMNDAITGYTGSQYSKIRDLSRTDFDSQRKSIESYIDKAPTYNGEIYRGIATNDTNFIKSLQNDATIDMRGISSWSSDSKVANKFATKDNGKASYHVVFKCKNKSGVGIQHLSNFATGTNNESEVLQSSKTKFKIKSVILVNGIYNVDVSEV